MQFLVDTFTISRLYFWLSLLNKINISWWRRRLSAYSLWTRSTLLSWITPTLNRAPYARANLIVKGNIADYNPELPSTRYYSRYIDLSTLLRLNRPRNEVKRSFHRCSFPSFTPSFYRNVFVSRLYWFISLTGKQEFVDCAHVSLIPKINNKNLHILCFVNEWLWWLFTIRRISKTELRRRLMSSRDAHEII